MQFRKISDTIVRAIASKQFFIFVLIFLGLQAVWLAVSASFPMLYDEYYHPGLIDLYSRQWLPFISSQTPEQTAIYMDITRVPSYLYHYLLSFPYRVITHFSDSFYIAVVSMRLVNAGFVIGGLVLFRKLLSEAGLSRAVIHGSLLALTLLPIFPYVAAHVNYDNLLFLLTPLFLLFGLRILKSKKPDFVAVNLFISTGLLACLVKYTFLPIFAAGLLFVAADMLKRNKRESLTKITRDFLSKKLATRVLLSLLLIFSVGLFAERYLVNLAVYGAVQPSCQVIHGVDDCRKQPVIRRNMAARQAFIDEPVPIEGIVEYTRTRWIPGMVVWSSFASANVGGEENFAITAERNEVVQPVPILETFLWIALPVSLIFLAYSWRELRRMPYFWFFVTTFLVYLFSVWIYTNYLGYRRSGQAFAIQPRYFLVLLPILLAYITQAASFAVKTRIVKLALFALVLIIFTQGGGITTYIVRSNEGWYWQREKIIDANMKLKETIAPFIKEQ